MGGGGVHLDNGFEDVQFSVHKCATVAEAARHNIGTHHTSPRKLHALWRAYTRSAVREGWIEWDGRHPCSGGGRGGRCLVRGCL